MKPSRAMKSDVLGRERWRHVESLLDVALELPPGDVAPYLDRACAGDHELRAQIELLLRAEERAGTFLSVPAAALLAEDEDDGLATATPSIASPSLQTDEPAEGPPPSRLGRYSVLGEMGRGGMGVVYLGRDESLGRTVAIKRLPERFVGDAERLGRFLREAKLLATLHHPNIATIHGVEQSDEGERFLILERAEGRTLDAWLRERRFDVAEALDVCAQIAAALGAAHALGIIHRDLKPGNVMRSHSGLVKVLDFGLAKHVARRPAQESSTAGESPSDSDLTEAGTQLGTPGYMSPEQILGLPHTARCDVFAFGCVLYQCLTGERAFAGSSPVERASATLSLPVDLSKLPPDTPAPVRDVLSRCLEKDPAVRVGDIGEVAAILAEAMGGSPALSREPKTPSAGPENLPSPTQRFIGREREVDEVVRLLDRARLVTLTGAGGCGKTRLAIEIARSLRPRCAGGVWFADLAPVADSEAVPAAVAAALGLHERAGVGLLEGLEQALGRAPALLVLDNCEHLIGACARLAARLLASCPQLRILATSREWLGAAEEQAFPVVPLSLPDPEPRLGVDAIADAEAVRLFVDRARSARRDFRLDSENAEVVARICRSLDGIPLGIELAAARMRDQDLERIASPLDHHFGGGAPGAMNRHETLHATIQWSVDQLAEDERRLFSALAVFTGGWSLDAATAVCMDGHDDFETLDLLTRLVDKSLVVIERAEQVEPRYRFLEPIRQFAATRFAGDDSGRLRERHLQYVLELTESSAPALASGPDPARTAAQLEADHPNLLAAIRWCVQEGRANAGLRLAGAAWWFWFVRGHFAQGRDALARVLALPGAQAPTSELGFALYGAGGLAVYQGDYAAARRLNQEALDLFRSLGDRLGIARALTHLGIVATGEGHYGESRAYYVEALGLFRELGDHRRIATTLNNLGALARQQGEYAEVLAACEEAVTHAHDAGYQHGLHFAYLNLAWVSMRLGRVAEAREHAGKMLRLVVDLQARRAASAALEVAAEVLGRLGDAEEGARLVGAAEALRAGMAMPRDTWWAKAQAEATGRLTAELGGARFESLRNEGTSWSFETAVEHALGRLEAEEPPSH